jgi:hypothetical protein
LKAKTLVRLDEKLAAIEALRKECLMQSGQQLAPYQMKKKYGLDYNRLRRLLSDLAKDGCIDHREIIGIFSSSATLSCCLSNVANGSLFWIARVR